MNNLFKATITIVYCLVLAACMNTNSDDNQSDNNKQDQTPDVQIEKEPVSEEPKDDTTEEEANTDAEEEEDPSESETEKDEVVLENEAFQIFEPTPNEEVQNQIVVRGLARVFEGAFIYEFEDGHFILDEGFTTASEGAPGWGEFEFTINLDNATAGLYRIVIYEESAKDGSILNELIIPVQVVK